MSISTMMRRPRLFRFIMVLAAGGLLLAALFLARPLYLSDAFLIAQLERRISTATGLNLSIQSGHLRLRKAVILRGITLNDSTGGFSVTADELLLRFRLPPLLQKRTILSEITLLNPQVHIISRWRATGETPAKSSQDKTPSQEIPSRRRAKLPFDIQAAKLILNNASFSWENIGEGDITRLLIPGINLEARNVRLTRQAELQADWTIQQNDTILLESLQPSSTHRLSASSHMRFEIATVEDSSCVLAELDFKPWLEFESSRGAAEELVIPEIALNFDAKLAHWRDLTVDSLHLKMNDLLSLQAEAVVEDLFRNPSYNLQLSQASISLEPCWDLICKLANQLHADSLCSGWKMAGQLQLQQSALRWVPGSDPPDLHASLHLNLSEAVIENASLGVTAANLSAQSSLQTRLLPKDSLQFSGEVNLQAGLIRKNAYGALPLELSSLNLIMSGRAGHDWSDPHCQIELEAQGPFRTRLEGNFTWHADKLNRVSPLLSPGSMLEGGASLDGLPLEELFAGGPRGDVSVALDVTARSLDDLNLRLGIFGWDVWTSLHDKAVWFPPFLMRIDAKGAYQSDLRQLHFGQARAEWDPYFTWTLTDASTDFHRWEIGHSDLAVNLAKVLPVLRSALPPRLADAQISGQVHLTGPLSGSFTDGDLYLKPQNTLAVSQMAVTSAGLALAADSVSFMTTMEGNLSDLAVAAELQAGAISLPRLRRLPYCRTGLQFGGRLLGFERLDSLRWRLRSDELRLECTGNGWLDWANPWPQGDLANRISFASLDTIAPLDEIHILGYFDADFRATFSKDSSLSVTGRASAESLFVDHPAGWAAQNLAFDLSLHQNIHFSAGGLQLPLAGVGALLPLDPVQLTAVEHQDQSAPNRGVLRADEVQIVPYRLNNLSASVILGQGFLGIPQAHAQAYQGDLRGAGNLYFSAFRPDSIRYDFQCDAQKINSARLPGVKSSRRGQETEITAFTRFHGRGLDWRGDSDLEGELEISRIGRGVADNILKFMDPEGDDPGIRTYRRYLKRGWGVKSFNFEVRDDFVYASIIPAKPPISKPDMFILSRLIGLGQSVTFGRMPVSFFLTSQNTKPP